MYLTSRSVWAMALGCLAVVVFPRLLTIVAWCAGVCVLIACDVLTAPSPRLVRLHRQVPRALRLGESTTAILTLINDGERDIRLHVRDAWPPSAGARHERATLRLPGGQRRRHHTVLTPTRRGDRIADLVTLRSRGFLGLAGRQISVECPAQVRVLPAFTSRRHLPSRLARLREMDGRSTVMVRGAGTEFDSLREYVVGDDVRSIDWRSTARRGDVLVRTWRPERDRRVLIIIDTGRLSAARLGNEPRLDAQIEACLLLAALASKAGDRVDVMSMGERVGTQVHGESGPSLMSTVADALAPVEPELAETNWLGLASHVKRILSHHALVVVLTALDGAGADVGMLSALASLTRQHTVLVASASDPQIEILRLSRHNAADIFIAASAERELLDVETVRSRLRRGGVEVVDASADDLAPALADAYLALKAAGRL